MAVFFFWCFSVDCNEESIPKLLSVFGTSLHFFEKLLLLRAHRSCFSDICIDLWLPIFEPCAIAVDRLF